MHAIAISQREINSTIALVYIVYTNKIAWLFLFYVFSIISSLLYVPNEISL